MRLGKRLLFSCPVFMLGVGWTGHLHVLLDDDTDRQLRLVTALLFPGRRRSLGRVLDWAIIDWLDQWEKKLGVDGVPVPPKVDVPEAVLNPVRQSVTVQPSRRGETVRDALRRFGLAQPH